MQTPTQSTEETKPKPRYPDLMPGRDVHYINSRGDCCAAKVTKVINKSVGLVSIVVFDGVYGRSQSIPETVASLQNIGPGKSIGQWHWMRECPNHDTET